MTYAKFEQGGAERQPRLINIATHGVPCTVVLIPWHSTARRVYLCGSDGNFYFVERGA